MVKHTGSICIILWAEVRWKLYQSTIQIGDFMARTVLRRILIILVFILACGSSYLRAETLEFQNSDRVAAGLENGEISRDYNFYFSGSRAEPHTIIAVKRGLSFDQALWQGTDSSPEVLRGWYAQIDSPHRDVQDRYFGGLITRGGGEVLGLWYSQYRYRLAEINSEGVLSISRPFIKKKRPRLR